MLSDQSSIGDSNRAETDGAGRLGDGSAPAAFRGHFLHFFWCLMIFLVVTKIFSIKLLPESATKSK